MSADNQTKSKVWLRRTIEILPVVALIAGIRGLAAARHRQRRSPILAGYIA